MLVKRQVDTKWTPNRQTDAKCTSGSANGLVENAVLNPEWVRLEHQIRRHGSAESALDTSIE
jgi:hypothetical protein